MKSVRNFLTVLSLALLSNFAHAGDTPKVIIPENTQIKTYLKAIDFNALVKKETKVMISFMVNAQNEVMVVSTNNADLDNIIKSTLNYKKLAMKTLEYNKVYTVPVLIQ